MDAAALHTNLNFNTMGTFFNTHWFNGAATVFKKNVLWISHATSSPKCCSIRFRYWGCATYWKKVMWMSFFQTRHAYVPGQQYFKSCLFASEGPFVCLKHSLCHYSTIISLYYYNQAVCIPNPAAVFSWQTTVYQTFQLLSLFLGFGSDTLCGCFGCLLIE